MKNSIVLHYSWATVTHRLLVLQSSEWDQFQSDLLMTVRVANDFKTEAQQELEKLVLENKSLRDKLRGLEAQIDKLKGRPVSLPAGSHHIFNLISHRAHIARFVSNIFLC